MTHTGWVIGARGLLGRATTEALRRDDAWETIAPEPLPWSDDEALRRRATESVTLLLDRASASGGSWAVFWTAGTVVTSSPAEAMAEELRQFRLVLDVLAETLAARPDRGTGCLFFASSAGGVYGGSVDPPFTEFTDPVPISPYGRFKLDAEALVEEFSRRAGVATVSGRISNLYGPGQRLEKMQGLISHIARAQLSPAPASIYVTLDTLRDYVYVDDCAALIVDVTAAALAASASEGPLQVTKNLISGQSVTISSVLGYFRTIAKGHPHVMLGSSPASALQAVDLRLASVVWPELDRRDHMPLPAGIHATLSDVLAGIQRG
ncbi:NAD-dependent epimerase/dehydratase family protein [Agromyces sp. LHK192]|uniref:NAD-dependent epimerase/dehydratase family protein n=1 Tax=Agromyces sp. LHK192 TaxID=2498704 RepID=UPI000FDBDD20|nr:NAD-dependent epimerase/dehydratase family protein [Agromyces sp. LHK192]